MARFLIKPMTDLQQLCELGQQQLMRMEYLVAERTLVQAEELAWNLRDFDTLARLYMPLQETRRQIRQRCGEGVVRLDLLAQGPQDPLDPRQIVEKYPHGQLLVAGWGSIDAAAECRRLQRDRSQFAETLLAAAYPVGAGRAIAIVPLPDVKLPPIADQSIDDLSRTLPAHTVLLAESEIPKGDRRGSWQTYAEVMSLWERLHVPFLAAADMQVDPIQRMEGYRKTIRVDYACELAHQKLADVAKSIARDRRAIS
jgi:hypothetical protein